MNGRIKTSSDISTESKYILHPDNIPKLLIDILGFLIIIYQTITVPFNIAFDYQNEAMSNFDYFSDIFFIIDIFINFNIGYYKEGLLIMNRKQICLNYLKGWLIFDGISSFPYSFILDKIDLNQNISNSAKNAPKLLRIFRIIKFIKILRLLKILKLRNIFHKLEEVFNNDKIRGIYIYIKQMVIFFFIWHLFTCIWYAITENEFYNNPESFGAVFELYKQNLSEKYGNVLYFIMTSFFTIGYGDFNPVTNSEKLFGMFVMLLCYGLFCYMVGMIRDIIQRTSETEYEMRRKLRNVKSFFKEKNLPKDLTNKVTKYLEFMYTEKVNSRLEGNDIFSLLNDKLGNELRIEMNERILLTFELFKRNDFEKLINKFCNNVYEEIINPNEVIITEGDLFSRRMYFIDSGSVLLYHDVTTIIFKELGPCEYFGEIGFFTLAPYKEPRTSSAITKSFCHINFILQSEFIQLIENSNDHKLQMEMNQLFENSERNNLFEILQIKCFYCKMPHFIKDCPKFHKLEKLIFISKERENYFSDKLLSVGSLNDFKSLSVDHFEKLKQNLTIKNRRAKREAFFLDD